MKVHCPERRDRPWARHMTQERKWKPEGSLGRKGAAQTRKTGPRKAGEGDSIVWPETKASAPNHYTELPNHFLTAHLPFNLSVVVSQALTAGRMIRFLYFTPLPRVRESAFQCRRHRRCGFNPWAGKIPWRRAWPPTSVLLSGEPQGPRHLVDYSP